jgi:hypothetical protein
MGIACSVFEGGIMSLSPYSLAARTVAELQGWFNDIVAHLQAQNYDNGDWTPEITGMTGTPTVAANFQRFGKICWISIIISGTHLMADAEITLPLPANGTGSATITSVTDESSLGSGIIEGVLKIKSYFVEDEVVEIRGSYPVEGI